MQYLRRDKTREIVKISEDIKLIPYETHNDGACQCYKDCDCANNKGIIAKHDLYKHSKAKTMFSTLEECVKDLNLTIPSLERNKELTIEALDWFNSKTTSEQNKLIDWLKLNHKQYKRQTHSSVKSNPSIILALHRLQLKHIN